jgi:hypothetical protein
MIMKADADFLLKIRIQSIFKALGYYTRVEVKLAESDRAGAKNDLTDLDVLAIAIMPDLTMEYVVADCTTNKTKCSRPTQRIFWLRGVMDFFNAQKAHLVLGTNTAVPHVPRAVATKLGIGVITNAYLLQQEKRTSGILPSTLKVLLPEAWDYLESNLTGLDSNLAPIVEYRRYDFWQRESYQNLQDIISLVSDAIPYLDAKQRFHRALVVDLLSLYTLALLQLTAHVMLRGADKPAGDILAFLLGGESAMKSKERMLGTLRDFVRHMSDEQPTLFGSIMVPDVEPPYFAAMVDVVSRLLSRPLAAAEIPNFLQAVLFERILNKDPSADYHEVAFDDLTKKLARDIATFFVNATGLDPALLGEFL